MTNLRLWIVLQALVTFLAGAAAGKLWWGGGPAGAAGAGGPAGSGVSEGGAMADYQALFAEEFELDADRRRLLRVLLEHYDQEVTRIRNDHLSSYRSAIEPELRRVGIEYNQYIRDKVLPPSKRPVFDQLARGPRR